MKLRIAQSLEQLSDLLHRLSRRAVSSRSMQSSWAPYREYHGPPIWKVRSKRYGHRSLPSKYTIREILSSLKDLQQHQHKHREDWGRLVTVETKSWSPQAHIDDPKGDEVRTISTWKRCKHMRRRCVRRNSHTQADLQRLFWKATAMRRYFLPNAQPTSVLGK